MRHLPDPIPQVPGFGHGLRVFSHDPLSRQESQNCERRETAEKACFRRLARTKAWPAPNARADST
jgi:hypothetical protein